MNTSKLRVSFLKKCCELSPFIRVQDLEDTIYNKKHQLLKGIFDKTQHYKLLKHSKLLIYPIENDKLSEMRIDLDNVELSINIDTMFKIKDQLSKFGINATYEYTGSKGCHIKFLINVSNSNLKYKYDNVNLNEFEKEFRSGNKQGDNYKIINCIAKERLNFKKQLAEYLGLYNIISLNDFDTNLLSSFYLLGCPGSVHRKTNKNKLYLDLNKLNSVDKVLKFIASNPLSYIDYNFLTRVWNIPTDFKFNFKLVQTKKTTNRNHNNINSKIEISETEHKQENLILNCLTELYNSSQCNSSNGFSLYVVNILYSFQFNLNEIKSLHNNLFKELNLNDNYYMFSNENILEKYNYVDNHFNLSKVSYGFKDFWTQNDFLTKLNENKRLS